MKQYSRRIYEAGFSMVEALIILVFLAAIVGVGYFVVHKKPANTPLSAATAASTKTSGSSTSTTSAPLGTTASIAQITQQDATSEEAVDNSADSSIAQQSISSNSAIDNVGGAYNASSL